MDKRQEYLQKIDAIPTVSFNKEQKEIAKKIIAQTADADLSAVFGLITQRVKTGFVFDEAPEVNHNAVALAVEKPDLNIGVSGLETMEGKTEHTLIIGENYDALKNLCATYIDKNGRGLIDVIYIDPPYNTEASRADGNDYKDEVQAAKFIYRDKFTRDGWLNMMNERLKLARRLLSDKGVIFISIDDSEQAYLKVLCDEIFGEENFVACFKWKKKKQPSFLSKVATIVEYVLCYAKVYDNIKKLTIESVSDDDKPIINASNQKTERIIRKGIRCKAEGISKISKGIYQNKTMSISIIDDVVIENGRTINDFRCEAQFRTSQEKIDAFCNNDLIFITKNLGLRRDLTEDETSGGKSVTDLLLDWGQNQDGSAELNRILGKECFSYPKPVLLVKNIIKSTQYKSSTILDFFAGSGTTGQAVMELNEDDHGNRKFILVTNNENGIGEKITRERLYRVINGKGSGGEEIAWKYSAEKPCLQNNCVRVFGIETHELTLQDLDKAEKLKEQAKTEFKKLNSAYDNTNDFDIYNELAALNPIK